MANKKILYISSNESWGGSEELWTRSAKKFSDENYSVVFASKYNHENILSLKGKHYLFRHRFTFSLYRRIIKKFLNANINPQDLLISMMRRENPALVIISQGNNIDHDNIMECCRELALPYVTITNLVTEYHFLSINNENLNKLQQDYLDSKRNFFVSFKNLSLNNLMLAINLHNAEIIPCPLVIDKSQIPEFPYADGIFEIGLVGRIECFHKGYDLLMELASMEKWRARELKFNVYGDGPHTEILKQNIARLGLHNVILQGYARSVEVWKKNQLLFMPSRMEGVSLSLIEAMYCRRAAIVTDVGDAAKLIKDNQNGFVSSAAALIQLDEALERAWEKRHSWKDLGLKAFESLKDNYSYHAVELFNEKILKILGDV